MSGLLAVVAFALFVTYVQSVFEVELAGIRVIQPATDKKRMDMALANFGQPVYGAQLVGQLVYPSPSGDYGPFKHDCLQAACNFGCTPFNESTPPFRIAREPGRHYIMLLDRGPEASGLPRPCYFLDKVYHAQLAGADAVLVANDHPGDLSTAVAPQDDTSSLEMQAVTISAGLVTQADGDALKALLRQGAVTVALNWTDALPRADAVAWEFWTNSNDECGATCDMQRKFVKEFRPVAEALEQAGALTFTPHYLIWVCQMAQQTPEECASQCVRGGRYCCPDPDDDIHNGYSGRDVLRMNIRSVCFHRVASKHGVGWLWWSFVDALGDTCRMGDGNYTATCAQSVFNTVTHDHGGADWLAEWFGCWGDTEGEHAHEPIPLLEEELALQTGTDGESTVAMLPTVRVNGKQYRGGVAAASVLRALCASFPVGGEPAVCNEGWVSANECAAGSEGAVACRAGGGDGASAAAAAGGGGNRCVNVFAGAGYKCECGAGYLRMVDGAAGTESCADVNECLMSSAPWSRKDCTCERCACVNLDGGFKCTGPVPNMCTAENNWGGCWAQTVGGELQHACVDNINEFRSLAVFGRLNASAASWRCRCPPCWKPTGPDNRGCQRVCDSAHCDVLHGACDARNAAGSASGGRDERGRGLGAAGLLMMVLLATVASLGAVYGVYQLHLRRRLESDMRSILEEYVPLASAPGGGSARSAAGSDSGASGGSSSSIDLFSQPSGVPSEERMFASSGGGGGGRARRASSAGGTP